MNCGGHKLLTSYYNGGIKCFRKACLKIVSSPKSSRSPGEWIYISFSIISGGYSYKDRTIGTKSHFTTLSSYNYI